MQAKQLENEMEEAKNRPYHSKKLGITIGFRGHNTMNDGLVVNAMTNCPSTQACPLCHKKQSEFNKENVDFDIIDDFEKYGLSTLHAGINMGRAVLKIASQMEVRQHRVSGPQNKLKREVRKKEIAAELWEKEGIKLDHYQNMDGI